MTAGAVCESCRVGRLGPHCDSPTCAWVRCPRCCLSFNPHTRSAYDRDWRPVTWPVRRGY